MIRTSTNFLFLLTFIVITSATNYELKSTIHNDETFNERKRVIEIDLNDSFDKHLPTIRRFILSNGMEPMKVPDYMLPFAFTFGLGRMHLQRGWVHNIVTIKRTGDVKLRYGDSTINFDLNLGFDNLEVNYDYTMRYLAFIRKGAFSGSFYNLNVKIMGSLDMETQYITLDLLKFVDAEDFTLKLDGHIADHLINVITRLLTTFAKERVLREIEYQSTKIINEAIKEINESKQDVV